MYSHSSVIILYRSTISNAVPLKPPIAYIYWQSLLATAARVHLLVFILFTCTHCCFYKSNLEKFGIIVNDKYYFSTVARYYFPSYPPIAYMPSGRATAANALLASFISGSISHSFVLKLNLSAVLKQLEWVYYLFSPFSLYGVFPSFPLLLPPPYPPIAYIMPSGPRAAASSSLLWSMSGHLDQRPFLRSRQSNFLSTALLFPPQKNILPSSRFTQAAKPERGLGSLKGRILNLLVFRLNSSISEQR